MTHDQGSGLTELFDGPGVIGRDEVAPPVGSAGDRHVADRERPFDQKRDAVQRPEHHAALAEAVRLGGVFEQGGIDRRDGIQRLRRRDRTRLVVGLDAPQVEVDELHRGQRFRVHRQREVLDRRRAEIEGLVARATPGNREGSEARRERERGDGQTFDWVHHGSFGAGTFGWEPAA